MNSLLSYLQSPATLIVATTALVAIARKAAGAKADGTPRIDGSGLVLACAAVCGSALAGVQAAMPWLIAFVAAHPAVGAVVGGAVAGATAFGLHDVIAGLVGKASGMAIDARTGQVTATSVTSPPPRRTEEPGDELPKVKP